jgi:NitT/TauT family transport system substrate-binding protein
MRNAMTRRTALGAGLAALASPAVAQAPAEARQIRLIEQLSIMYVPIDVMVHNGLVAKHAQAMGLGQVSASATTVTSAAGINDAILSGSADYGTGGPPPLLTMWDRTRGNLDVRAIGAMAEVPMQLYTTDPRIRSIADFRPDDRIALPAPRVSFQAIVLQIAAERQLGDAARLDQNVVAMGHPDAIAQMSAGPGRSSIAAHFAVPPFTQAGLRLPGARVILDSQELLGGAFTQMTLYCTRRFKEGNPRLWAASVAAYDEAVAWVAANKRAAAELWKRTHSSNESVEELLAQIEDPRFRFTTVPNRTMMIAETMHRRGLIRNKPDSWRDYFWENVHGRAGS